MSTKNKWFSLLAKDEKMIVCEDVVRKEQIQTPSVSLNWALGGGFYRGNTICLYGPEGGGKSLTTMMAIGALHQADPEAFAVLISTEMRAPAPERARALGVDPSRLIIRQVNSLRDVFDWIASSDSTWSYSDGSKSKIGGMRYLLESGMPIRALIIDSIKGIAGPKEAALETVEKEYMGDLSKFLNPALRLILPVIRKYDLMTIFVQQVSMNMNPDEVKYQNKKWIVPSGQALKHFCETMALVERVISKDSKILSESVKNINDKDLQQGHTVRVKVEKANLDKPFREAEFQIDYDKGIVNTSAELAMLAQGLNIVRHPLNDQGKEIINQWTFKAEGFDKTWVGFAKAQEEIENSPELREAIMKEVYKI